MNIEEEDARRREFKKLLNDLAERPINFDDQEECRVFYPRLENLYYVDQNEQFRHFYSDIFSVLTELKENDSHGDVETLASNISGIRAHYAATEANKDISKSLRKLYDHVSLDVARMNYSDAEDWEAAGRNDVQQLKDKTTTLGQRSDQLVTSVETAMTNVKMVTIKVETALKKVETMQKDFIAIFGIFASVVVTFMAGMVFDASVLDNMGNVSSYRLAGTILFIGWFLFNLLYFLFSFIHNIVKPDKEKTFGATTRLFWWNTLFCIGAALVVLLAWYCGLVEYRSLQIAQWFS